MDSLCIEQDNNVEKAVEIRHMADFYSQAVCCVVVSEMLRRRYAHCWEERGRDRAYYPEIPSDNISEVKSAYKEAWGLHDEVLGWIVGYHELRCWVFQETYFAKMLVHRGRSIRINTSACLGCDRNAYPDTDFLSRPWHLRSPEEKTTTLRILHWKYLRNISKRFPTVLDQMDPAEGVDEVDYLLEFDFLRQKRLATKPQDAVYSLLSLYPRVVRFSMPIRYDISKSTTMAILKYLRIHAGDVRALTYDHSDVPPGTIMIENAPSWLPRYIPRRTMRGTKFCSACYINIDSDHKLVARAQYVPLIGAQWANKNPGEERISEKSSEPREENKIMQLWLLPQSGSGRFEWNTWKCEYDTLLTTTSAKPQQLSDANDIIQGVDSAVAFIILLGTVGKVYDIWMILVGVHGRETYIKRGWLNY